MSKLKLLLLLPFLACGAQPTQLLNNQNCDDWTLFQHRITGGVYILLELNSFRSGDIVNNRSSVEIDWDFPGVGSFNSLREEWVESADFSQNLDGDDCGHTDLQIIFTNEFPHYAVLKKFTFLGRCNIGFCGEV